MENHSHSLVIYLPQQIIYKTLKLQMKNSAETLNSYNRSAENLANKHKYYSHSIVSIILQCFYLVLFRIAYLEVSLPEWVSTYSR